MPNPMQALLGSDSPATAFPKANANFAARFNQDFVSIDDTDSPYAAAADGKIIVARATGNTLEVELPPAASSAGKVVFILGADLTNDVRATATGSDTVNGTSIVTVPALYYCLTCFCDGVEWFAW